MAEEEAGSCAPIKVAPNRIPAKIKVSRLNVRILDLPYYPENESKSNPYDNPAQSAVSAYQGTKKGLTTRPVPHGRPLDFGYTFLKS
jgi:hypothetical protein